MGVCNIRKEGYIWIYLWLILSVDVDCEDTWGSDKKIADASVIVVLVSAEVINNYHIW